MKYVQHQLGHASITMAMNQYTHLLLEITNKYANLIDNIIEIPDLKVVSLETTQKNQRKI